MKRAIVASAVSALLLGTGIVYADDAPEADAADEGEPDPARPPPKGQGVIWGVVRSNATKDTLIEAQVTVVTTGKKVLTDLDGRFRVELPPGTYELRVFYELHKASRIQNLVVTEGKVQKVDVALDSDKASEEVVEAVVADVERGSVATQLQLRKAAAVSSDSVGAADIAKAPDRTAADAIKRVVGTSVVDGRFVYVRGLGERYTNARLDGAPMPSPEPDRAAIPLDMFPSLVLSDLTVIKTFSPDMPGDFTGGSVVIHTRDLPTRFRFQATLGLGLNTQSTFGSRLSYRGGSLDWLGIDDGTRSQPSQIPNERIVRIRPDGTINPNLGEYGRSMLSSFEADRAINLPNGNGSFVLGDSVQLGKVGVLGFQVAASYTRRFQSIQNEKIRTFGVDPINAGKVVRLNDYESERGTDYVTWSTLGKVSFASGKNLNLSLLALLSRSSEKDARQIVGFNDASADTLNDVRLRFLNRQLVFTQLNGEHLLGRAQINWYGSFARATLEDPDLRQVVYSRQTPTQPFSWTDSALSGLHFYGGQRETTYSAGLDYKQPITAGDKPTTLKVGGLFAIRRRSFDVRRFRFAPGSVDPTEFQKRPDELFVPAGVGQSFDLTETTNPTDSYVASHNLFAGYLMTDFALAKSFRFVVGQRIEASRQTIDSFDPFAPQLTGVQSTLDRVDILPAGHFIWEAGKKANLRLSFTRTVARPQLRELAPFLFTDFSGAREVLGNPELDRTSILNGDLRFELFPGQNEVIAVTTFYKNFTKPIERVIIPTSRGVETFQNAQGATNVGLELEARKGLGFIHPVLKDFSLLSNLTFVYSRVHLDTAAGRGQQTNLDRPLAGQSPYVFNAALDYSNEKTKTRLRVLYNIAGPRIAQVGIAGLDDIYEQPRNQLDFTAAQGIGEHLDLKLTVENILNAPYRFSHGSGGDEDRVTSEFRLGANVWLLATITN